MSDDALPAVSMADVLRQRHRAHAALRERRMQEIENGAPGVGMRQLDLTAINNAGGGLFMFTKLDMIALALMVGGFLLLAKLYYGVDYIEPLWDAIKPDYDDHLLRDSSADWGDL